MKTNMTFCPRFLKSSAIPKNNKDELIGLMNKRNFCSLFSIPKSNSIWYAA